MHEVNGKEIPTDIYRTNLSEEVSDISLSRDNINLSYKTTTHVLWTTEVTGLR